MPRRSIVTNTNHEHRSPEQKPTSTISFARTLRLINSHPQPLRLSAPKNSIQPKHGDRLETLQEHPAENIVQLRQRVHDRLHEGEVLLGVLAETFPGDVFVALLVFEEDAGVEVVEGCYSWDVALVLLASGI